MQILTEMKIGSMAKFEARAKRVLYSWFLLALAEAASSQFPMRGLSEMSLSGRSLEAWDLRSRAMSSQKLHQGGFKLSLAVSSRPGPSWQGR